MGVGVTVDIRYGVGTTKVVRHMSREYVAHGEIDVSVSLQDY
jgi:hypothetical protein